VSQLWRSWTTQGALRDHLIIPLHLLLAVKLWPEFGEGTCSAFKDCPVFRLITAEQYLCEKVCIAT